MSEVKQGREGCATLCSIPSSYFLWSFLTGLGLCFLLLPLLFTFPSLACLTCKSAKIIKRFHAFVRGAFAEDVNNVYEKRASELESPTKTNIIITTIFYSEQHHYRCVSGPSLYIVNTEPLA